MYSRILAYGCSFTVGHGIADVWNPIKKENIKGVSKHSWPQQVANKLQLPLINHAVPGSSNKEILWKILSTEFKQTDLVLIHWTFLQRDVIIGKKDFSNPNYHISANYNDKISKFWKKNFATDSNLEFNSAIAYMLTNYYLKDKNISNYNLCVSYYKIDSYNFNNQIPIYLDLDNPLKGYDGKHPSIIEYTKFANKITKWLLKNNNHLKLT